MRFTKLLLTACVFTFCLFSNQDLKGQKNYTFEVLGKNKFTDGYTTGGLHKFRHVFRDDEQNYKRFKRFNRARKTQIVLNSVYTGLIGIGIAAAIYDSNSCDTNTNCGLGALVAIGFNLGIAAIAGITHAIINPIKNSRKRKLLKNYFGDYGHIDEKKEFIQFNITASQYGVGIGMFF